MCGDLKLLVLKIIDLKIGESSKLKVLKICWYSKFEIVGTQKFGYSKFVGT